MFDLGFFVYMNDCEEEENNNSRSTETEVPNDGSRPPQTENDNKNIFLPDIYPPRK